MRVSLTGLGVIALFYLIPFQDLVTSYLFMVGFPKFILELLLILKELVVLALGCWILARQPKVSTARLCLLLLTAYALLTVPFSTLPIYSTLLGLRTYLLLLFSFVIGEQLSQMPNFQLSFLKHLNVVFWLVLTFSILEYFVLPMSIWKYPFPIMQMKREVANLSTTNEYYDFGYPVNAFGELTRRLLGPFDEPLYMAYFTVIILNFYLVKFIYGSQSPRNKTILGSVLILLTQTRAIILGLVVSVTALLTIRAKIRKSYVVIGFAILILLTPVFIYYAQWIYALVGSLFDEDGRNRGHIDAYTSGLKILLTHPFGGGIGSATTLVGFSKGNNATENAFVNVGLEIGILGMVGLFVFFVFLAFLFRRSIVNALSNDIRDHNFLVVCVGFLLIVQFTFAGLVAPHILTARILIPFMIIMGWAYGSTKKMTS